MRRIALFIGPIALAACSGQPANDTAAEEPAGAEAETATMVTANGSNPGTFEVTAADGSVSRATLNPDGTYTQYNPDGSVEAEGTWSVADGKTCFAPTTEGEQPMCYTETAPAADGSFTATPDEGEPVTVKPVTST